MASEPSTPSQIKDVIKSKIAQLFSALKNSKTPKNSPKVLSIFGVIFNLAIGLTNINEIRSQPFTIPEMVASPCNLLHLAKNSDWFIT
jgi:hypothetical protein